MDFLYYGEANVYQEDLDSFLAIAEAIQLKGLTGQITTDLLEEQENPIDKSNDEAKKSTPSQMNLKPKVNAPCTSAAVVIPSEISADLDWLDERVKSMIEKGQKMITIGKQHNGTPMRTKSCICKVCVK